MNLFQEENKVLIENFLNRTFLKSWANPHPEIKTDADNYFFGNYSSLELDTSYACSNKCKYCYSVAHAKEYYPAKALLQTKNIFKNAKIVLDWLEEKNFQPRLELFGGDALSQNVGYMILNEVLAKSIKGHPVCREMVIPTNMNFLFDDNKTKEVEEFIEIGQKYNTPIFLSASIDGLYMEDNRPLTINKVRDANFYDKLFRFTKKHGIGFHPMIYSNNIENWIDNFKWFQEKFREYNISPTNIYLLEVRNPEWTEQQCKDLYKFMRWLAVWVSKQIIGRADPVKELFRNHWGYNILVNPFSQTGRGMGCSFQSCIYLRLGDLTVFPCHRLFYDYFKLFTFKTKDGKIEGIDVHNPELFIATNAMHGKNFPMCEQCVIREMCNQQCLGSSFESTGDMFIPDPAVCRMSHYKILGILHGFKKSGMLDKILDATNIDRRKAALNFIKEQKNGI